VLSALVFRRLSGMSLRTTRTVSFERAAGALLER
jgi:hypothetical protein